MHELRLNQRLQLAACQLSRATCICKWPLELFANKQNCHPDRSVAQVLSATHQPSLKTALSPLSSRPERSVVEGSAVRPSVLPNFQSHPTSKQNSHPPSFCAPTKFHLVFL